MNNFTMYGNLPRMPIRTRNQQIVSHVAPRPTQPQERNPKTAYYYTNLYPGDVNKQRSMPGNVRRDLKPFRELLEESKRAQEAATSEGADVIVLNSGSEKVLVPSFCAFEQKTSSTVVTVKKPQGIFKVECKDDFDADDFEITHGRNTVVCSAQNKVDLFGGVFVKVDNAEEVDTQQKAALWGKDDNLPHEGQLIHVDYANKDSYRIEGIDKSGITAIKDEGENIKIYTKTAPDGKVKICRQECEYTVKKTAAPVVDKDGVVIDGTHFIINRLDARTPKGCKRLSSEEVLGLLKAQDGDAPVGYANGQLLYRGDEAAGQDAEEYSGGEVGHDAEKDKLHLGTFTFTIKTEKIKLRRKLVRKGKPCGILIEVAANERPITDTSSNVDVFFNENIEELTDAPDAKHEDRRNFKIGGRDEETRRLEIAEEKNGRLEMPQDVPGHLYAVPNTRQLQQQIYALNRLTNMPVRSQNRLLELCEMKDDEDRRNDKARWGKVNWQSVEIGDDNWCVLTREDYDGCGEQREFVKKALATPDFSFLDGPPGSGKTTVILELIAQYVLRGQKVLLTASTNAAVDNILERLNMLPDAVRNMLIAVRLGNDNAVAEKTKCYTVGNIADPDVRSEVISRANLVCGTIYGVLRHPEFNLNDRAQPAFPLYDCLIIDEASKTTFQDFLVPALYAKKWVLSGDLKQLTPFVDQETIEAAIRTMSEFDLNMQFIQSIVILANDYRLREKNERNNVRFYFVCNADQIKAAEELLRGEDNAYGFFGIVSSAKSDNPCCVSADEIRQGAKKAVVFYGAKFLLIQEDVAGKIKCALPQSFIPCQKLIGDRDYYVYLTAAAEGYIKAHKGFSVELGTYRSRTDCNTLNEIYEVWQKDLREHSWVKEITWRLCRIQELFQQKGDKTVKAYKQDIERRLPKNEKLQEAVRSYIAGLVGDSTAVRVAVASNRSG